MNDLPTDFDAVHKVASFPSIKPSVPERTIGKRREFRTIWISDVHLGTRGCNHELLIDFLDHTDSETMYLVGDIIDGWRLKKKVYWPPEHNDIVWRILKRAKRGTRIVYIPGNHDEMVRPFSGMNLGGVEIMRAAFHDTADGRRLMVLHGDEFDTIMLAHRWLAFVGDALYHVMMKLNNWVAGARKRLGLPYWSISKAAKHKVKIGRVHFEIRGSRRPCRSRTGCRWRGLRPYSYRRIPHLRP
jgi:UDP-2,3-diacylglucosamine pyrophosphatase LpxH